MLLMDRAAKPPKGPGQDSDDHPDGSTAPGGAAFPSLQEKRKIKLSNKNSRSEEKCKVFCLKQKTDWN